ncbi:MAG: hypothetical protein H7Y00_12455 [Fimbriimonadaceae bacterium]|nr:hypothetical protein [Chitinophagales bacterium]
MKNIFFSTLFAVTTVLVSAQMPDGPPDNEKVESLRIAFLTNYLDLTSEESQKFWPVYNQMRDELKVVMDKEMNLKKDKDFSKMSDAELNQVMKDHFDNEQKILDTKKKYAEEFKKVLPLRKVVLLADAENEFKRKLLEHAKDRKGPGGVRE